LHALIPLEVFKIDDLSKASPEQLRQLKDGLAIAEAMQQCNRSAGGIIWQKTERKP
jgi:hypothetical protein